MKYFIIAGEASGDLHAAKLVNALQTIDSAADLRGWGGDDMKRAGAKILKHIDELAFMGFAEVIANLGTILSNFKLVKKQITEFEPDALILVDYPGFNLRIAKWARAQGIKIYYYIAPQAWAWKAKRVQQLKAYVDELYVILPFEKDWFEKRGMPANYLGHPLLDTDILEKRDTNLFIKRNELSAKPIIALLPGSRRQELNRMQEVFAPLPIHFTDYQFVVAGAPGRQIDDYRAYQSAGIPVVFEQTYDLLHAADYALVTSGTATLETALIGTPQLVCYRTSAITYFISKSLIKIPYISLANLIADKMIVPELIQAECSLEKLKRRLEQLIREKGAKQKEEYEKLKGLIGEPGTSAKVAEHLYQCIKSGDGHQDK